ncbi:hypothetical protein CKQ79_30010, partial [Klebsiella pneumoniae]
SELVRVIDGKKAARARRCWRGRLQAVFGFQNIRPLQSELVRVIDGKKAARARRCWRGRLQAVFGFQNI